MKLVEECTQNLKFAFNSKLITTTTPCLQTFKFRRSRSSRLPNINKIQSNHINQLAFFSKNKKESNLDFHELHYPIQCTGSTGIYDLKQVLPFKDILQNQKSL